MKNDLPPATALQLTRCGASELAQLIAQGHTSAAEAVEQHIARIRQVQPRLNAICAERFDAARAEARDADERQRRGEPLGPLHGVPVTIKDSLDLQDLPSTFGLPARAGHRAQADEVHVARLRAAGAIPLAKTNVAQALLFYETDNPLHGRTFNPWNVERTPGGSSGGEAALVACGASPLGLGTDIGGSVRIPSAFCGVVGFKPTAGRCDDYGRFSVPLGQRAVASQVGPIARTVDDVALALRVIDGGADPDAATRPLGDLRSVDLRGLRVACCTDDGTFAPAPAVTRPVREAADILRAAGAQVSDWTPPGAVQARDLFYAILGADGMRLLKQRMQGARVLPQMQPLLMFSALPRALVAALQSLLRTVGQPSLAAGLQGFGHTDTAHYWQCVEALHDYRASFRAAMDTAGGGPFDLILCPPCPLPAFTHGATKDLATAGAYACLYNLLGYPAGVVPVTRVREGEQLGRAPSRDIVEKVARQVEQGSAGLPVGVQVVARPWKDHLALAAMAHIERVARARPGFPAYAGE